MKTKIMSKYLKRIRGAKRVAVSQSEMDNLLEKIVEDIFKDGYLYGREEMKKFTMQAIKAM